MRIAVLTGLFACTLILSLGTAQASASTPDNAIQTEVVKGEGHSYQTVVDILTTETAETVLKVLSSEEVIAQNEPVEPVQIKHVVAENETLTEIAKKYNIEWKRLYDKNSSLVNPDLLEVGSELLVPSTEEVIAPRELPVPTPKPVVVAAVNKNVASKKSMTSTPPPAQATQSRGSASGNGYVAGYCTWYVKNKRPDLPNNLGNAISWVSRAAAQGLPTGSSPQVGAVGQRGNHVVYVESVNNDGTVTISEMNHKGLYVQTTRTLPATYFSYIY